MVRAISQKVLFILLIVIGWVPRRRDIDSYFPIFDTMCVDRNSVASQTDSVPRFCQVRLSLVGRVSLTPHERGGKSGGPNSPGPEIENIR